MGLTSGFFNSLNGDRKYNAEQLSSIFDGVITDGVYASIGSAFMVNATTGNAITVGTGRAWINHVWVSNDTILPITASESDVTKNRYDAVVIEVDRSDSVRAGSIKIINGEGSSGTPLRPTLTNTDTTRQFPIAYIYRPAGSTAITQDNITYNVGTAECPYVASPLKGHNIENIVAQWNAQFYNWFNELNVVLGEDVATELASRVLLLENQVGGSEINRDIFRGKNLGTEVTANQLAVIRDGSFRDIFLGDYWEINGIKWRIADFDYWMNIGDSNETRFTSHHLVMIPDSILYTASMNSKPTVVSNYGAEGGYVSTEMYKTKLESAKSLISEAFGDKILSHREMLVNRVQDANPHNTNEYEYGMPERYQWCDSTVEIPSAVMILGNSGVAWSCTATNSKTQLALFRSRPEFINSTGSYWLRDVRYGSLRNFCNITDTGVSESTSADISIGVRPVFAIG